MEIKKIFAEAESSMKKTLGKAKEDLSKFRVTKADVSILQGINVDYQGTSLPLNQLATIISPEPKTLEIRPWDRSILKNIEKAIYESKIGLTPMNDGKCIRLKIPPLTIERREELVKNLNTLVENFRMSIRTTRRSSIERIRKLEKEKKVSKDERYKSEKKLQELSENYIEKINQMFEEKKKEIERG